VCDPTEFVAGADPMVIDEVQRVPELLLAIKETVDADPRLGRFLLTGSARVRSLRGLPDTLPRRMERIELWPLSQGEIEGKPDGFVAAVFALGPGLRPVSEERRSGYVDRVIRGGSGLVAQPQLPCRGHAQGGDGRLGNRRQLAQCGHRQSAPARRLTRSIRERENLTS
jgi:hypothetical protein